MATSRFTNKDRDRWLRKATLERQTLRRIAVTEEAHGVKVRRTTISKNLLGRTVRSNLARVLAQDYLSGNVLAPEQKDMVERWLEMVMWEATLYTGYCTGRQEKQRTTAETKFESVVEVADYLRVLRGEAAFDSRQDLCEMFFENLPENSVIFRSTKPEALLTKNVQKYLGGTMTEPVFVQRLTAVTKYLQRANLTARSGLTVAIIPKEADTGPRIVYGLRVLTSGGDYTEPLSYIGQLTDYEAGDRVLVAFTDDGEGVIIGVLHPSARDKTGNISQEFSGPHMPETGVDPAPVVDIVVPPGETPQYPPY